MGKKRKVIPFDFNDVSSMTQAAREMANATINGDPIQIKIVGGKKRKR